MAGDIDEHDERDEDQAQYSRTFEVMRRIGVSVEELWIYYLSMGGDFDEYEVDAYFHGMMRLPAIQRDMLSQSVNELLDDMNRGPRAPYSTRSAAPAPQVPDRATAPAPQVPDHVTAPAPRAPDHARAVDAARTTAEGDVLSIVYSSVATQVFTEPELVELLRFCRQSNGVSGLTGLLLYRAGRFLQVIEGPEAVVRDLMARITADARHTDVRILVDEERQHRHFPNWTMGFEVITDSLADGIPGFDRIFADAGSGRPPADAARVTERLMRWFEEHARQS